MGDLLPRAESRGLIGHLRSRAFVLIAIFGVGFIGGYPLAGRAIEILLDSSDYRPDGVEVIILHPMEGSTKIEDRVSAGRYHIRNFCNLRYILEWQEDFCQGEEIGYGS